ncbi:stage V sporulation protein AA [Halalkalibacillus halophilus]|uniref:stage V sporulation protein AA n=1 Tax=Halalkalibacillus halophilus TaxID=392827 RepID=UPI00041B1E6B|nr:stage V sporulation protein AA [Halalkalibacillus halophilus]
MNQTIYLRLKNRVEVNLHEKICLKDIAWVDAGETIKKQLHSLFLLEIQKKHQRYIVIDIFHVTKKINHLYPELEIETVGPNQAILQLSKKRSSIQPIFILFIWTLLFIGAAMAIMNFHYDVSMQEVQESLHIMLSGSEENRSVLWLQIPYSLGLGVGMIIFFNHVFNKRLNEEPSPLEVEMFNYEQNLQQYLAFHENDLNRPTSDN